MFHLREGRCIGGLNSDDKKIFMLLPMLWTMIWAGWLRSEDSIPSRGKRFFSSPHHPDKL
jgi:hypothetical protein